MSSDIGKKLESKIDRKLAEKRRGGLFDGFKKNKVINEVLDKSTMLAIHDMINSHIISYVNGVISAGKESVVFWAVGGDGADVALKVYLVTTSNFKRRAPYILGDPRFTRLRKGTRNMVYLWARKEFANLSRCYDCGISVPRPIHVSKNILAMEFVGRGGAPSGTLLDSAVDKDDYNGAVRILRDMYGMAGLVHGDFSPYNVFKTRTGLSVFDLGSAVDVRHPNSGEFLKRDINNMTNFFVKRGLTVENPVDVYERVTG